MTEILEPIEPKPITCGHCGAPHTPPDRERSDICDDCHGRHQAARVAAYGNATSKTQDRASVAPAKGKGRGIYDDELSE